MRTYMRIYTHPHIYIYIYVYIYIHMFIDLCIHAHKRVRRDYVPVYVWGGRRRARLQHYWNTARINIKLIIDIIVILFMF